MQAKHHMLRLLGASPLLAEFDSNVFPSDVKVRADALLLLAVSSPATTAPEQELQLLVAELFLNME